MNQIPRQPELNAGRQPAILNTVTAPVIPLYKNGVKHDRAPSRITRGSSLCPSNRATVAGFDIDVRSAVVTTAAKCRELRAHIENENVDGARRVANYIAWTWSQAGIPRYSRIFRMIGKSLRVSVTKRTRCLLDQVEFHTVNLSHWLAKPTES